MIWNGIESNRSCILVANSTFKNANCTFNLCESGFTMTKSNIYIPANGIGIEVTNDNDTNLICIDGHNNALNSISSMPGCSSGTIGILMQSEYQPFYVRNTNFSALETAIQYPLYAVKMDSISFVIVVFCFLNWLLIDLSPIRYNLIVSKRQYSMSRNTLVGFQILFSHETS